MKIFSTLRKHKKKSIAGAVVLLLMGLGIANGLRPKKPEYLTELAKRGEVRQTVEAVGTVVSERELELRFSGVGIVSQVSVKEGQRVKAGQRLATLKAGNLSASIASQQAAVQSALADLRGLEEGTRPEDIAVAEADVAAKRASLQVAQSSVTTADQNIKTAEEQLAVLRSEAAVSLSGQLGTSLSGLSEQFVSVESALSVIDDILSRVDVQDALLKDSPGSDNTIRAQKRAAQAAIDAARRQASSATEYQGALTALASGRSAFGQASDAMDALFSLVSSLRETPSFTNLARENYKTSISTQRAKIQDAASGISSSESALSNASASYDTRISTQQGTIANLRSTRDRAQNDIVTYEAAIRTSEAQLAVKKAGTRKSDIDASRARVRAAQANLARAQADFADTVLTAPIAGTVTHINVKIGEALPAGPAVTLLGDSPFRVEMFVSEIDVPKLALTQSGSVELDAFRGVNMKLRLSEVDSAPTLKDGVSKYGATLDFLHNHPELRIGMTGDAQIVTGTRSNVISVPRRAVLEDTRGAYVRVLKPDTSLEERPVTMGMEGESGDVEIISGVQEGETVVVLLKK